MKKIIFITAIAGLNFGYILCSLDFSLPKKYYRDEIGEEIRKQEAKHTEEYIEQAIKNAHNGDVSQYKFLESMNNITSLKTKEDLAKMAEIRKDWKWINGEPIYIGTNIIK